MVTANSKSKTKQKQSFCFAGSKQSKSKAFALLSFIFNAKQSFAQHFMVTSFSISSKQTKQKQSFCFAQLQISFKLWSRQIQFHWTNKAKQSKDILLCFASAKQSIPKLCFAGSNQIQAQHVVQKSLNPEPSFQFMATAFSISLDQQSFALLIIILWSQQSKASDLGP